VRTLTVIAIVLGTVPLFAQAPAAAPAPPRGFRGPAPPKGPTPRLADGKVDFSGVWNSDGNFIGDISRGLKEGDTITLTPAAAKTMKAHLSKEDPEANCLPTGVPRMAPYPWRIVTTPTHVFFLFEGNIHSYRQVFMDGRKHSKDPNPTWYGESIGRWDGDTLVVDTIGFNDKFWFDFAGHPHSEQLHTVERYTRIDLGNLVEEVTIDDPGAYAKPFTITSTSRLQPKGELMEYICQENNPDPAHIQGPAGLP
jgi:hypothetical protein